MTNTEVSYQCPHSLYYYTMATSTIWSRSTFAIGCSCNS